MAVFGITGSLAGPSDGFFYKTKTVTERVTLIFRPDPTRIPAEGNVTVIEQADGLVVVDAGGSPIGGLRIVEKIKSISRKPVRFLIYTHYHGDHNLGAGAFLKAWPGLVIVSTAKTRANMIGAPMDYIKTYDKTYDGYRGVIASALADPSTPQGERSRWKQLAEDLPEIEKAYRNLSAYPAQVTFDERLVLNDNNAPVEISFPGNANTDGDAIVWMPKQRVLCSGDIVVHPVPYASASFPKSWMKVLEKLNAMDFAYLIPGHGAVLSDHVYLEKLIGALGNVRGWVAPYASKGVAMDDVYKAFQNSAIRETLLAEFAGDDAWNRRWMRGVFLSAFLSNAYKEARGEAIVQGHDGG